MDELEREFRAALGHLADGPEPSDDLVGRTVERSVQIRRHRRVLTVAGTAGALVVTLAIVSIAGAATRNGQVEVSGPGFSDDSTTTTVTTVAPILIPASTTTNSRPSSTTIPVVAPTSIPRVPCTDETVVDDDPTSGSFTLLASGNIEVSYYFPFGPAREDRYFTLDDGTSGTSGFTKEYTPDQFGPHWYEEWSQIPGWPADSASCKVKHNFLVDPSVVSPTTTSEPTTSVPVETTIPASDMTVG